MARGFSFLRLTISNFRRKLQDIGKQLIVSWPRVEEGCSLDAVQLDIVHACATTPSHPFARLRLPDFVHSSEHEAFAGVRPTKIRAKWVVCLKPGGATSSV